MTVKSATQAKKVLTFRAPGNDSERDHSALPLSPDEISMILHIFQYTLHLCQETEAKTELFCHELLLITNQKAHLLVHFNHSTQDLPTETQLSIPVQFKKRTLGTLCIIGNTFEPERLTLSFPFAQLLAQMCGWVLYSLEQGAFLNLQYQHLTYRLNGPLTQREKEVLLLICQCYDTAEIAAHLCISKTTVNKHRQHIYEQLGVHNEYDARLVAYRIGLYSALQDF